MSGVNWFASQTPVRHAIVFPGARDVAVDMRARGAAQSDVDAFLDDHTFWVEVKELSAGDRAHLEELRFGDEGGATLSFGEQRLVTVQMCLVSWSLPEPLTPENIRGLKPLVLQAIFEKLDDGRLIVEGSQNGDAKGANGSGPPPQAIEPAEAKDAAPAG